MINKKSSLNKRYQASYQSKGNGGSKKGVMNWNSLDSEVSFFQPAEGRNRINIIPYVIKTKNHPLVKKGEFEIGEKDYLMDLYVHKFVGPTESTVICLKSTYGKPCPICEQSALFRKQGKEKEANELKASRRVFYNVQDMKDPEKLKVFETSHFLFEKELIDEARDDENGFIDFADEENGKEIKFRCNKVKKGGFEFNEFKSFSFEDREETLSDELIESAISFDEIMNVPTYEEVQKILFGDSENDEEEEVEEKTAKKSKYDDEEEETEKPTKKVVEDSDDKEEEKPAKKSCSNDCGDCPFNHKFGKDCDEFDDCNDCDVWDKCCKAN